MRAGLLWAVLGVMTLLATAPGVHAAGLPPNFVDEAVASVPSPTAIAFTPDGRMLVTSQSGMLYVFQSGTLTQALDLTAQLCNNSERGLLGVAVDPAFAAPTNHAVYLYYTRKTSAACPTSGSGTPLNRVSRFVLPDTNHVDPSSEVVLLDNIPSPAGNHNGGDLKFGKDGYLYVSVGDGGCDYAGNSGCAAQNDASRDRNVLLGKVLRITRDGNAAPGNPFLGVGTANCRLGASGPGTICRETFAWGLRNPYRLGFDPNAPDTRFFIDDVGQSTWEEIDLGTSGADYGWNVREGHCATGSTTNCGPPPAGMTNPIFDYGRDTGCGAITGGAFVPNGLWPSAFDASYLYADYNCGTIFELDPQFGGGYAKSVLESGLGAGGPVALVFGPYGAGQALYYTTYAGGGQVRRIRFQPPPRFHRSGPVTCNATSPRIAALPPLVYGSGSNSEYVLIATYFLHWNGTTWTIAHVAPTLLSAATASSPTTAWWNASDGTFLGPTSSVLQTYDPQSGYSLVVQAVYWLSASGQVLASDTQVADRPSGPNALPGSAVCAWP
jgi:glucose/arabinose dehydrogenase